MEKYFRVVITILILVNPGTGIAETSDPWKPMNKKIHNFNESADKWIAKPIAKAYDRVLPEPVTGAFSKFFKNLSNINNFVNNVFQFKLKNALTDVVRLTVNTTIGVGGLLDPATKMGLPQSNEDWGQTLATWNLGSGAYLVVPFLGPSTVRDSIGTFVDSFFNPVWMIDHVPTRNTVYVLEKINNRASLLGMEGLVFGDKYLFYRDAYLQRRDYLIFDGVVEDDFEDDF